MIFENNKELKKIHFENDYKKWKSRLSVSEYQAIENELNNAVYEAIEKSRPNKTCIYSRDLLKQIIAKIEFDPIRIKACLNDIDEAGKCYGVFLSAVIKERKDKWNSYKNYERKCRVYAQR